MEDENIAETFDPETCKVADGDPVPIPTLPVEDTVTLRVFVVIKTKSLPVVVPKYALLVEVAFVALLNCNPNPIGDALDDSMKIGIS
ncbi:unnamed protein product [Phytophthora lilii]|uniref:Unnamed protein product n=1 Tax=Phytophthora lilii TaxID=2077276 RepID=A0A9W6XCI5_9STRA|nr:unnamed protein product [Phytophthora lilii]